MKRFRVVLDAEDTDIEDMKLPTDIQADHWALDVGGSLVFSVGAKPNNPSNQEWTVVACYACGTWLAFMEVPG